MAPSSSASSSGFSSSSEDDAAPSTASALDAVHVEVVPEPSPLIAAPCHAATAPLLGAQTFAYDAFAAAVALVSRFYDDASSAAEASAYAALRASLFSRFQRAFPLPADSYALWLADVSAGDNALAATRQVFELALGDYLSVSLALQFARFLQEHAHERAETLEPALLRSAGLHFTLGHDVWRFYREQAAEDEALAPRAKAARVQSLFARQLALPLQQNDAAMSEFRAWSSYHAGDVGDSDAAGAVAAAATRQTTVFGPLLKKMNQFEARLERAVAAAAAASAGETVEHVWLQYLNFVTYRVAPLLSDTDDANNDDDDAGSSTGTDFVRTMFERAVAMECLSTTLWAKYAAFMRSSSRSSDAETLALCERRVRNVSFDANAWNALLLELERQGASIEQLHAVFEQRLARHTEPLLMDQYHYLSVLTTYCDVHRRHAAKTQYDARGMSRLDDAFRACEAFLETHFPAFAAGVTQVMEYHAKCCLLAAHEDTRTRVAKWTALWDAIVERRRGDADVWMTLFHESVRTGAKSAAEIRATVFNRAVQHVTDFPAAVLELWLVFERENGSLDDFLRVQQLHADAMARAAKAAEPQLSAAAAAALEPASGAASREARKRKAAGDAKDASGSHPQPRAREAKRTKLSARVETMATAEAPKPEEENDAAAAERKKSHEVLTNAHTLFVSNLSKDVTKDELEALFGGLPGFKEVRLVVKARASHVKSRGMAYIQFLDARGVAAGLEKNGLELKGKMLSVERSKPPTATAAGNAAGAHAAPDLSRDGSWKTDPVTIYVGGLVRKDGEPIGEDALQLGLQQALQAAGELVVVQRVSILKDRRGKPKDYGLVEVASAAQTAACVAHVADVQQVLGEQVSLKPSRFSIDQILRQQQNQQHQKAKHPQPAATGESSKPPGVASSRGPHSAASTAPTTQRKPTLGLMPRALRRKPALSAAGVVAPRASALGTSAQEQAAAGAAAASSAPSDAGTMKSKTNDDFRKLLMKQ
ncbi:hypothetical protein PybrP1_006475 [[Pythium] brassicae (nom. inval.)]|nr:hypothetical protein PybrP1_006475 [[Pythium] brassicae (nom. inval.)]